MIWFSCVESLGKKINALSQVPAVHSKFTFKYIYIVQINMCECPQSPNMSRVKIFLNLDWNESYSL